VPLGEGAVGGDQRAAGLVAAGDQFEHQVGMAVGVGEIEQLVREQTTDFLRLALAYHFFGPQDVQEPVAATPTNRLVQGKPRKDESLFAMVRLQPARDRLGRLSESNPSPGWCLTTRQEVTGHFKLQPHGAGSALRKLIWVAPYESWAGGRAAEASRLPNLRVTPRDYVGSLQEVV
jgi:hypothetical protein